MPPAFRRGIRTTEFAVVAGALALVAVLAWRGADPKHSIAAGIATATYAVARTAIKILALWIERKCLMNLKAIIAAALTGFVDKTIAANLTPDDLLVVNNAVAAIVELVLLLVEKEGVKLFAAKNPQLAAAIQAALNPPKAA